MQASLKKQTRQLRGMSACMGMASARKGKANMVPPMPLTPETKPPANQQTKTKISSASGMASSFLAPAWGRAPAAVMALTGLCLRRQDKNGFLLPSRRDDVHSTLPALLHGKAPIADGTPRPPPRRPPRRGRRRRDAPCRKEGTAVVPKGGRVLRCPASSRSPPVATAAEPRPMAFALSLPAACAKRNNIRVPERAASTFCPDCAMSEGPSPNRRPPSRPAHSRRSPCRPMTV